MFEKVNPAHPDKIADRIAGAIVDLAYEVEDNPKIAVEVLVGHGKCHAIIETTTRLDKAKIGAAIQRIAGDVEPDVVIVKQDAHLTRNQHDIIRCGDNGIFKGVPVTSEQTYLTDVAKHIYERYETDGKYIVDDVGADEQELNSLVDDLNAYSNIFNVCLDIGHVVLVSRDPAEVIRNIGHDRLKALHVHDNDFIADKHTIMGQGKIDFEAVMKALSDIDYTGEFTLEADAFFANFKPDQIPMASRFMVDVSRYWMAKFKA